MELSKKNVKIILGIITFAIALLVASQNISVVITIWNSILKIFSPVIVAFAIAFMLNIPMMIIETKIFGFMKKSNKKVVYCHAQPREYHPHPRCLRGEQHGLLRYGLY